MIGGEALSDYERKRLETIKKNQEVLKSLAIPNLPIYGSSSSNIKKPTSSSKRTKESKQEEPVARRTSVRLHDRATGKTSKMSIADELELYRTSVKEEKPPRPKRVLGNIPFEPLDGESKEFSSLLARLTIKSEPREAIPSLKASRRYRIDGEYSIAKVMQERIYSMAVHPNSDMMVIFAGGKYGHLGVWNATDAWNGTANDRVTFQFRPHTDSISNLRFNPGNTNQLFMTSYDGVIRCLDIKKNEFTEIYHAMEEQYIAGFDTSKDGSSIFFTDMDGMLTRFDTRSKARLTFQLHEKKAGGLSVSPVDNNYIATSSLDDTICIWDGRMLKDYESEMLARFEYKRAVTAVNFHPQISDALVSTCYDDTIRVHQGFLHDDPTELEISHNNQTGRWITPFKAMWDPKSTDVEHSHVIVGDMNRGLDLIEMSSGLVTNSISELLTSQPAVNCVHPSLDLIASGNATGKCILWKAY